MNKLLLTVSSFFVGVGLTGMLSYASHPNESNLLIHVICFTSNLIVVVVNYNKIK